MIDWSTVETTLEGWITGLTGLSAVWEGSPPKPSATDNGYLVLSISAVKDLGYPELSYSYDEMAPSGEEMTVSQDGVVTFIFGVQIRIYRQGPTGDANYRAGLIRSQVCLPTKTDEVLAPAGLAFARILLDTKITARLDGREMSVHQMDLLINAVESASDTPHGYIATLKDVDVEIPPGSVVSVLDFEV